MGAALSLLAVVSRGWITENRLAGSARILSTVQQGGSPWDDPWRAGAVGVSLFNALFLIFLGLTVVLTSRRRVWGVWVIATGLFVGSAVFLDNARWAGDMGIGGVAALFHAWWPLGWFPAVLLPFAWHVVMLWYAGIWSGDATQRPRFLRRHLPALGVSAVLALGGCAFFAFAAYTDIGLLLRMETTLAFGIPLMIWGYVAFVACATIAPAWALAKPPHAFELWRDLGRQRARPWLIAASGVMLLSGLAIAYVMLPVLGIYEILGVPSDYDAIIRFCAWCDLGISALVGVVILCLGQAVVAYEVFAGRTLPRRGLRRHAVNATILALAHSVIVPWASVRWQAPVEGFLVAGVVAVALYSVLAWGSHADHERHLHGLRPLARGRHVFDQLREGGPGSGEGDGEAAFRALCEDLLEAGGAALVPTGPFASLIGGALTYPHGRIVPPELVAQALAESRSPGADPDVLPPDSPGGYAWSMPLWGARGVTGVLLLAPKRHGGLYTQEEIATAQLIAERLLDTEASFRLAERLMELQRRRLAESQVLDRRLRREIHDEILPRLHAAMLGLPREGQSGGALDELAGAHRRLAALLREMPSAAPEVERLGLVAALRREIAGTLSGAFERVEWEVDPTADTAAEGLPAVAREVLFYAAREGLRNAAAHARGDDAERPLHLRLALSVSGGLRLSVEDDGVGIGATRKEPSTGGRGLALHSTMMAILGGDLVIESAHPRGTRVVLLLPLEQPPVAVPEP